ncbi:hypothetical protein J6590_098558 [Homalodisca vitripennis]|nr:hypothetical protein J6590_098558 [Homalodisca vitripennis]
MRDWDDVEHTFFSCKRWGEERRELLTQLQEEDLQPQTIIGVMLRGQEWLEYDGQIRGENRKVEKVNLDHEQLK